ncbi:MAG: YihY/virulence factor BrkB family protein [Planctomycetaceae bacterium]|nr:YihY/virulence factor BrkB family protein [Planctomycetaceae bacterium]
MKFIKITLRSIKSFFYLNLLQISASLAYYALFSLPAVIFILLRITALVIDPDQARQFIFSELSKMIGPEATTSLQNAVVQIEFSEGQTWKVLLSIIILIFTASTIFTTLQNSFNTIFLIQRKTEGWISIYHFILKRLLSIGILLGFAIILLFSLVLDMVLSALGGRLMQYISGVEWVVILASSIILPVIIITALFILIFKVLPDVQLTVKDVLHPSLLIAFLFLAGKFAIGYYIGNTRLQNIYSSATAVIALLLWSYYSSAIILFGCAFLKEKMALEGKDISIREIYQEKVIEQ